MSSVKAKFKISQLAAKPIEVELVHPVHGETGIMFNLVGPHSKVFQDAKEVYVASEGTAADNFRLMSACVIGWDEEAMEMPWSEENSFKFFSNEANIWAIHFLTPIIKDEMNFYPKK